MWGDQYILFYNCWSEWAKKSLTYSQGVPDLATRQLTHKLNSQFSLPVLLLAGTVRDRDRLV